MREHEQFEMKKKIALRKVERKEQLKPAEKIAYDNKWYFSIVLPISVIEQIVVMAEQYNVKPSEIAEVWIMKGLEAFK